MSEDDVVAEMLEESRAWLREAQDSQVVSRAMMNAVAALIAAVESLANREAGGDG